MMTTSIPSTCTAFVGGRRVAHGAARTVSEALAALPPQADPAQQPLQVLDDATGAPIDLPRPQDFPPPEAAPIAATPEAAPAPAGPGRPRLGVVAREVTLLPRHWEWLSIQRGGASAAVRRLVDEARHASAEDDARRLGAERTYRAMSALCGERAGFEEASRALFAHDSARFAALTADWPADVRAHLAWLGRDVFAAA